MWRCGDHGDGLALGSRPARGVVVLVAKRHAGHARASEWWWGGVKSLRQAPLFSFFIFFKYIFNSIPNQTSVISSSSASSEVTSASSAWGMHRAQEQTNR